MIKNSETFTDANGNTEEIKYTIINKVNDQIIAIDWNIDDNEEVTRQPTADEILAWEEYEAGLNPIRNVQVPEAAIVDLQEHLIDPSLTDIEEVKAVIKEFIDAII